MTRLSPFRPQEHLDRIAVLGLLALPACSPALARGANCSHESERSNVFLLRIP